VLLLGLDTDADALERDLAGAAASPIVAGFAIGRAIWGKPAEAYFAGTADDAMTVTALAEGFARFVRCWEGARRGS
jgi:5-dehydro-2-deoxygluconokinase